MLKLNNLEIKKNVPLHDKNWFQTGGPAKFYAEPTTELEFQECINYANTNNIEIFVLGLGANILISDDGFDGLVIRPALSNISVQDSLVTCGAGVSIENLITYCLDNNITGPEEFSGIPGTVGGSVYINIHYFKYFLSDFLISATIINKKSGQITQVDKNWFNFGYDKSTLINKNEFLVSATFKFTKSSDIQAAYAKGRSVEITRHRNARYPITHTCGSFFRNFHDNEVIQNIAGTNNKMIFVAYYFDKLGIKGELKVGDAVVSHKHANMLVNNGKATSNDIISLAKKMQELVKENFGIIPQPECQLIGFKEYPLI